MIGEGLAQQAADLDDGGVAGQQMLLAAIGDRAHGFLNGAILRAQPFHARIGFAARLKLAVDQIFIRLVANGVVASRIVLRMDAAEACLAGEVFGGEGARGMKVDAVEHGVFIIDRRPDMGGVRAR